MQDRELLSPVEVGDLPGAPAVAQVIEQPLVLPEQARVVGHREGLPAQAGDAVHQAVPAQVHPEVIPLSSLPGHKLHALDRKHRGEVV